MQPRSLPSPPPREILVQVTNRGLGRSGAGGHRVRRYRAASGTYYVLSYQVASAKVGSGNACWLKWACKVSKQKTQ